MADEGLALSLAAIIGISIAVDRNILKSFGFFLIGSAFISYAFAFDAFIGRIEGILLISLLAGYYYYLIRRGMLKSAQGHQKKSLSHPKLKKILGADVLNLLWIIGAAAIVNPIRVNPRTIAFAYPWMIILVVTMVILMWHRHQLTRKKGILLVGLYVIYFSQLVRLIHR